MSIMMTNTTNDEMNIVLLSYLLNIVFVIYFVFMRGEPFDYETFCLYMDEYKKACEEELPKKKNNKKTRTSTRIDDNP